MTTNNYEEMFIMATNDYEEMSPIFRTTVLVNKKPNKSEECPFYREQAVSYRQPINDKVYSLKTRIKQCCFFSQKECTLPECKYLETP